MNKPVFQLVATGLTWLGQRGRIHSKDVFSSRERAKDAIPAFKAAVTSRENLLTGYMEDDEMLKIAVVELNLIEN